MKSNYRDKYQIIKAILDALPDGKWRVMLKANMELVWFRKYLTLLISAGLIDMVHGRYFITKKGKKCLEKINEILILQQK